MILNKFNTQVTTIKPEDNDEIVDILSKVFGFIDNKEEIKRKISRRLNNNLSIKIELNDKIIGCYLLAEKSINEFIEQINNNQLKDFPKDETKIILSNKLSDKGIQGISLAILPEYSDKGFGDKLKSYVDNLDYDYIWGVQDKKLENINFWTKTRKILAESNTHFATIKVRNTMNYIKRFENYTFSDLFDKNKWVELSMEDRSKLKKEIWEIIDLAYKPLGGHVRISSPDAVVNDPDLTFWTAVDIDKDPNADVVIFSRESHGHKISGWGHDGTKEARKELMKQLIILLHKEGFWIEVSGRPAEILIGADCNYCDKQTVSKVFPQSKINWIGDGLYTRTLHDGTETEEEYLVGRPKV